MYQTLQTIENQNQISLLIPDVTTRHCRHLKEQLETPYTLSCWSLFYLESTKSKHVATLQALIPFTRNHRLASTVDRSVCMYAQKCVHDRTEQDRNVCMYASMVDRNVCMFTACMFTFLSTIKRMYPIVKGMLDEMCELAKARHEGNGQR